MLSKSKVEKEKKFSKEIIVPAKKYSDHCDLTNILLKDGQEYTLQEVNSLINEFLKRKVK